MTFASHDIFGTAGTLAVGGTSHRIHRLTDLAPADLPYSLRIVLENLLRHSDRSGHDAPDPDGAHSVDQIRVHHAVDRALVQPEAGQPELHLHDLQAQLFGLREHHG